MSRMTMKLKPILTDVSKPSTAVNSVSIASEKVQEGRRGWVTNTRVLEQHWSS